MFAILNISTYKGLTADAEHYYGTLTLMTPDAGDPIKLNHIGGLRDFYGEKHDVSRIMTSEDIEILSKKDTMVYFEGDKTLRFNSSDEVVKAGIELYHHMNLDCAMITLFNRKKYSKTIILEFFTKYLLTNDDGTELLFIREDVVNTMTPDEWFDKYCLVTRIDDNKEKRENERRRQGLKYIECYKEHPLAKYRVGDIIPDGCIWHGLIVNCIYLKNNKIYYRIRPSYVEGHYTTIAEEKL